MKLFQPDNFSQSEIRYHSVSGGFDFTTVLRHYFKEYTLRQVFQLSRLEINSENYKVILEIKGTLVTILVRKYKNFLDINQVFFYLGLLDDMAKNQAPVSPAIRSLTGDLAVEVGGNIFAIFVFVEGAYFTPVEEGFSSVAESIARLHNSFDLLGGDICDRIAVLSQKTNAYYNKIKSYSVEDFSKIQVAIANRKVPGEYDQAVLDSLPRIIGAVAEIKSRAEEMLSLPTGVIHSDLHPHNILIKNNIVQVILDFDAIRISQRARDIAFALYRFGRQFLVAVDQQQAKLLGPRLRGLFIERYSRVRKISAEEADLMPILVKDEFIKKVLLVLKDIYFEDNPTWAKDLLKFLVAIEEIDYFWPKQ